MKCFVIVIVISLFATMFVGCESSYEKKMKDLNSEIKSYQDDIRNLESELEAVRGKIRAYGK